MKKEDVSGLVVYIIIFTFAIVFGLLVLRQHASESSLSTALYIVYVIGAILSGILLNSIIFELGHVIGAKIGGYKIVSVNILGLTLLLGNKKRIKFSNYDGLTGETKIIPQEGKKNNPGPYLIFGSIIYAIVAAVCLVLFIYFNRTESVALKNVAYFLLVIVVIGAMILIYDIAPFRLDSMNDGYRLRLISNPKNKEAFNELLRVQYAVEQGQQDIEVKTFDEITNFTAELNLNKVYMNLDNHNFSEAEKLLDDILKSEDVSYRVYIRAKSQKIFIHLMTAELEQAKEFYDKEVPMNERREISEDVSMASIRAYILMSGLLDDSQSETERALNKVLKAYKKTSKNRQPIELKLYNEALEKVIQKHPKWELEGFLLAEDK